MTSWQDETERWAGVGKIGDAVEISSSSPPPLFTPEQAERIVESLRRAIDEARAERAAKEDES